MKQFPLPIRFSIPAVLLLFGSLVGLFSFEREVSLSYAQKRSSRQARFFGNQTSGMLEYYTVTKM